MSAAIASELTCKELVELVTDYLEDMLPLAERRRFERHVTACSGCRAYLSQMRALIRASGRIVEQDLPAAMRDELLHVFREWKTRL